MQLQIVLNTNGAMHLAILSSVCEFEAVLNWKTLLKILVLVGLARGWGLLNYFLGVDIFQPDATEFNLYLIFSILPLSKYSRGLYTPIYPTFLQ